MAEIADGKLDREVDGREDLCSQNPPAGSGGDEAECACSLERASRLVDWLVFV
jgi:hypothetical protein